MRFNIYIAGGYKTFVETAHALQYSLEELGHDVIGIQRFPEHLNKCEGTIVITGRDILPLLNNRRHGLYPKSFNVCFFMEQWRNISRYDIREHYTRILDIFKENTVYYPNKSIHCPLGWSPVFEDVQFETYCHNTEPPEETDFLLIGSPTKRRRKIVGHWPGMYYLQNCFGRVRDIWINRAKINIMLKAYDKWNFPPLHYLTIASKKKLVMMDGYDNDTIFKENKHFLIFKDRRDCLPWLEDEEARRQFAEEAYEDLKRNHNFTDYLREAIGDLS